jgi:uncharacterized protein YgiM (DUF1202 family)
MLHSYRSLWAIARLPMAHCFAMAISLASYCGALEPVEKNKGKEVPAYITAQHEKPRIRSVHTLQAVVRSGPSDKNYPTSTLKQGAVVDVYLETSDGWSGIRPPSGSHGWIPASVAYLLPGAKAAEIKDDETPAWIGSDSNDVSDFQWQVALKKSQQVVVLGEETHVNEDGSKQLWYRIAPPQGEFRWIKSSQLSDELQPVETKSIASAPTEPTKTQPRPNPSRPLQSPVTLANHQEPVVALQSMPGTELDEIPMSDEPPVSDDPGTIVWSNEQEVLAEVESQIRNEQVESQQGMGDESSTSMPMTSPSSGTKRTRIRPIPAKGKTKKQTYDPAADSLHHWDAVRSSEQKSGKQQNLRVGPMNSVLGLIGFSVVEADRVPVHSQIARNANTRSNANLAQVGPVGSSRLDRLPRPNQRGPSMTLPSGSSLAFDPAYGQASQSTLAGPTNQGPWQGGESTFSKWLNSRDPIFGQSPYPAGYPSPYPVGNPNNIAAVPPNYSGTYPPGQMMSQNMMPPSVASAPSSSPTWNDSSWYGIKSTQPSSNGMSRVATEMDSYQVADEEESTLDEFRTPEIQSALVELTQQVASPTESWNLSPLRNQAAAWVENGPTAMVRGEARLLMERIERFESLRQRTLGMAQDTSNIAQQAIRDQSMRLANAAAQGTGVITASATQSLGTPNAIPPTEAPPTEGDASGWLVQVHTSNPGQPQFALTDDAGNVIAYVQSTASLNLRRYLQQPVTIHGIRGYLPGLAAKQIVAERVVRVR